MTETRYTITDAGRAALAAARGVHPDPLTDSIAVRRNPEYAAGTDAFFRALDAHGMPGYPRVERTEPGQHVDVRQ